MYGPKYVWLLDGTFASRRFMRISRSSHCNLEEVVTAADGHFTLNIQDSGAADETTFTGKVRTKPNSLVVIYCVEIIQSATK